MFRPDDLGLPEPDAGARAHSERVRATIAAAIDAAGGFIPFDRYMDLALYAPGVGYYVAGTRKFGADGDFVTAPELTSLFGRTLARQLAAILDRSRERRIIELGAGSGKLAADILNTLGDAIARYEIVDVSPELRSRQRETLQRLAPSQISRVEWLDDLPRTIDGAVVMNEVLDALPVHVIARRNGAWRECGVGREGDRFAWAEGPLSDQRLVALAAARFPADIDYRSELNPAGEALVETIARKLTSGGLIVIDYGFPRREYYHPQRSDGTLMAHYRHRSLTDPFLWPGLCDLTAHVDFTSIAQAVARAGMRVAGFTSQAAFLLSCGVLERLNEIGAPESAAYLREASAVQTLTSPAEMGELFKVIAIARSDGIEWFGFNLNNRSHRL